MLESFVPGSRAPFSMDLLAVSMLVVVPTLTTALWLARRQRYVAHRAMQIALSLALALVIGTFEIEVRTTGWLEQARPSPYFDTWLFPALYVHLVAAIATTVLWVTTLTLALRRFPSPPRPAAHSRWHRRLARPAACGMYLTSLTGWTFYTLAFLAT